MWHGEKQPNVIGSINIEGDDRWKDYFKNTIRLGDLVLYPNRAGSSLWMNHGTVVARGQDRFSNPIIVVKKVQTNWRGVFMGHREVTIRCLDRVIALGRGHGDFGFKPRKAKTEPVLKTTWLDRFMNWCRDRRPGDAGEYICLR